MSIRNLDALLEPRSIALIGAGEADAVGRVLARNLLSAGFDGPIMPVDPDRATVEGVAAYPSIEALPQVPDLAVIASAPRRVPTIVAALAGRGTRAAVVTSSFAGLGDRGKLQQAVLEAARPTCMRILGPNGLGLIVPGHGLCVGLVERQPVAGGLALIAQSAGVLNAVSDWAGSRNIGFSHLIAPGEMADVDIADLLDFLATDRHAHAIVLHVEAIADARKFMSAARAAARARPVVVIKAGRFSQVQRPARAPGNPVGGDAVYRAAFRRAGMLEIASLDEAFDTIQSLASGLKVRGDRLTIVSDSGGMGVLAVDRLLVDGGHVAELAPETMAQLNQALPAGWGGGNPVDLGGDADGERYGQVLDAVLADPGSDGVLVVHCPSALADCVAAAQATVAAAARHKRPMLTSWLGETAAAGARKLFAGQRIATYATPGEAVRAFLDLARYRRNQTMLREVPPSISEEFSPRIDAAQGVIDGALADRRDALTTAETEALLAAYDISTADGADPPEIVVEVADDPLFGPVIAITQGGAARSIGLPPLNLALAQDLVDGARIERCWEGLTLALVQISQLVCDLDRVVGLELGLTAGASGVRAQDHRTRISSRRPGAARLAIRPYPKELEQPLTLRDGATLLLRPIRPEDAPALRHMVEDRTEPEDRRLRFFTAIRTLSPTLCARLTQIDYDREMALVAIDPSVPSEDGFCGIVRLAAGPDRERAEYAVLVRSDLKGQGLGRRLMEAMIGYARSQGIGEVFGEVLRENVAMLRLAEDLGFRREADPGEPALVVVRLRP